MWFDARDKSKIPRLLQKRNTYEFIDAILYIAAKEEADVGENTTSGIMMGSIYLPASDDPDYEEGEYSFVVDDDPFWGSRTTHWTPLPEEPDIAKNLTHTQWEDRTKVGEI